MKLNQFKILVISYFVLISIGSNGALAVPFPFKNPRGPNQVFQALPKWMNGSPSYPGLLRAPLRPRSSSIRNFNRAPYRQMSLASEPAPRYGHSNHNSYTDCNSKYNYRPILAAAAVTATSTGLIQSYLNQADKKDKKTEELLATLRTSQDPKQIAEALKAIFEQDPNDIRVLEEVENFVSSNVLGTLGPVLEILKKDEPSNWEGLATRRILKRFNKLVASTFNTQLQARARDMPPVRAFMDYFLSASLYDGGLLGTLRWPASKSETLWKDLDSRSANKEVSESLREFFRVHPEKAAEVKDLPFFRGLGIGPSFFLAQYPPDKSISFMEFLNIFSGELEISKSASITASQRLTLENSISKFRDKPLFLKLFMEEAAKRNELFPSELIVAFESDSPAIVPFVINQITKDLNAHNIERRGLEQQIYFREMGDPIFRWKNKLASLPSHQLDQIMLHLRDHAPITFRDLIWDRPNKRWSSIFHNLSPKMQGQTMAKAAETKHAETRNRKGWERHPLDDRN